MTAMDTETTVFEDLDLDFEISCDSVEGCSKKPDWRLIAKCCGHQLLLCDGHFWSFVNRNKEAIADDADLICGYCHAKLTHLKTFSDWMEAHKL